jgi:hypothetical protein
MKKTGSKKSRDTVPLRRRRDCRGRRPDICRVRLAKLGLPRAARRCRGLGLPWVVRRELKFQRVTFETVHRLYAVQGRDTLFCPGHIVHGKYDPRKKYWGRYTMEIIATPWHQDISRCSQCPCTYLKVLSTYFCVPIYHS